MPRVSTFRTTFSLSRSRRMTMTAIGVLKGNIAPGVVVPMSFARGSRDLLHPRGRASALKRLLETFEAGDVIDVPGDEARIPNMSAEAYRF